MDARLKENELKTDRLFKILQTKEGIDLGLTRLYDTSYKTDFGKVDVPTQIHFKKESIIKTTDYNKTEFTYSKTETVNTVNSRMQ